MSAEAPQLNGQTPAEQLLQSINYENVPKPHERTASNEALETSYHETNHLLLAKLVSIPVLGVSTKPEGISAGRTIVAGHLNPTGFQIVAAGGACNTPIGRAEGYGSDMAQVYGLSFANGYAAEAAISDARMLLASIPDDVKHRIAQIIASMGEVMGESLIDKVIEIASLEARFNITSALSEHAEKLKELRSKILTPEYADSITRNERTIIETPIGGGITILIRVTRDEEGKEHTFCTYCHGQDDHKLHCPLFEEKDENGKLQQIFPLTTTSTDKSEKD